MIQQIGVMIDLTQFRLASFTHGIAVIAWIIMATILIAEILTTFREIIEMMMLLGILSLWVLSESVERDSDSRTESDTAD
jgi:hypothetical protein